MTAPKTEEEKKKAKEKEILTQKMAVYTGIPALMAGGLGFGCFVGYFLDRHFHGNNIIMAICGLIGFAAGVYQVIELLKKFN